VSGKLERCAKNSLQKKILLLLAASKVPTLYLLAIFLQLHLPQITGGLGVLMAMNYRTRIFRVRAAVSTCVPILILHRFQRIR
jgi:hypothetical protein